MDYQKIVGLAELLAEAVNSYESGDLMKISEIRDLYEQIMHDLQGVEELKKLVKFIRLLSDFSLSLSEADLEDQAKTLLIQANETLIELFSSRKEIPEAAQEINTMIQAIKSIRRKETEAVKKDSEETEAGRKYSETYFSNIVNDKKMLGQLVDEMRDFLDSAQYTLVELEYDHTNPENINKVFRSFHTIKGSSSFLGLKNVEEVAHEMESLLVLIRDNKLRISKDLIDVIFFGIELLRTLASIMEINDYEIEKMVPSFKKVEIFSYINVIKKILENYEFKKIGEILEEEGKLHPSETQRILEKQSQSQKKFGEIAVEERMVSEADITDAMKKQIVSSKKSSYVRVSNERLNSLIDMVGELVINQSMLKQVIHNQEETSNSRERTISQLETITTNIKNLVLSMGMVPIAEIFNKLRVVVRNTAKDLNKAVVVDIRGEETELDRNVMESIYDPLVHIVRNAVDHGLEPADLRETSKKDRVGKIVISAEHKGNGIEISVYDDGRGIDTQKVMDKALKLELITEDQISGFSDKEIYNFMFLPGFSTAEKVSEVSGRGVGLDVVKKNIDEIHGRVDILSEKGNFTKFVIKLPLTLAIIEGFVTEVGQNKYVFPFNTVEEIIVPESSHISVMEDGTMMLYHRGNHTPVIYAGKVFNEQSFCIDKDKMVIIIIAYDGKNYGIVVDRVVGKQETVIKNLSEMLSGMSVFSGGTIFGDGAIGFVVDIEGFLEVIKK